MAAYSRLWPPMAAYEIFGTIGGGFAYGRLWPPITAYGRLWPPIGFGPSVIGCEPMVIACFLQCHGYIR